MCWCGKDVLHLQDERRPTTAGGWRRRHARGFVSRLVFARQRRKDLLTRVYERL